MEQVQRAQQLRIGFEELPAEPLHRIDQHEGMEAMPPRPALLPDQRDPVNGQKHRNGQRFIDLHRMARDPVTQIDAPGQAGGGAVGLVAQPREQAAPAPYHDAQCEWDDERPAGRAADMMPPFPYLDRDDPARQRAGDAVRENGKRRAQSVARSRRPCARRGA